MSSLVWLDHELWFPSPHQALEEPNGLLCVGGDLSEERLLLAYRNGIFPWYEEEQPILWWSPEPRCIITSNSLHVSRSLKRALHKSDFKITFDTCFSDVISSCAAPRTYSEDTWITKNMAKAYIDLHKKGHAHSIEVWKNERLIGGLYGIAVGGCFFGESMFSRQTNASKIALVFMVRHLTYWGYGLFDCQVVNPHLLRMGAFTVPRSEFLSILESNIAKSLNHDWQFAADLVN